MPVVFTCLHINADWIFTRWIAQPTRTQKHVNMLQVGSLLDALEKDIKSLPSEPALEKDIKSLPSEPKWMCEFTVHGNPLRLGLLMSPISPEVLGMQSIIHFRFVLWFWFLFLLQILDSEKILKFAKKRLLKFASRAGNRYSEEAFNNVLDPNRGSNWAEHVQGLKSRPEELAALSDFLTLLILALEEHERKNSKASIKRKDNEDD